MGVGRVRKQSQDSCWECVSLNLGEGSLLLVTLQTVDFLNQVFLNKWMDGL